MYMLFKLVSTFTLVKEIFILLLQILLFDKKDKSDWKELQQALERKRKLLKDMLSNKGNKEQYYLIYCCSFFAPLGSIL